MSELNSSLVNNIQDIDQIKDANLSMDINTANISTTNPMSIETTESNDNELNKIDMPTGEINNNSNIDTEVNDDTNDDERDLDNSNNDDYNNESSNSYRPRDDVIPNAIVIKNIPFAIKKEQLLDIIDELGLPLPYAFNYHFDNGIFRGLAFANFTTPEETMDVINGLNGKDINGRKLKVEYKKLLPQHERERIEREKREKRGQLEEQHRNSSNISLHSLNKVISNSSLNPLSSSNNNTSNNAINNNMNINQMYSQYTGGNNNYNQIYSQYTGSNNNNNHSINSNCNYNSNTNNLTNSNTALGLLNNLSSTSLNNYQNQNTQQQQPLLVSQHSSSSLYQQQPSQQNSSPNTERYYAPLPSATSVPIPPQHLDFNDPDTLEIYSQLLLFKDREKLYYELAYPTGLSANHKRIINVLCAFLNLVEVYDPRFVIIRRKVLDQSSLQNHLQQQGQLPLTHSLQPTSTGGSLNRSHSYTSLLQAHASAINTSSNNNNNSIGLGLTGNGNSNHNSANTTPKLASNPQLQYQQNVLTSGSLLQHSLQQSSSTSSQQQQQHSSPNTPLTANSLYNNDQLQQPQPISSQNIQSTQQQQQSFIRQQATLTPSSRVPSGYSTNHQSLNSSNPLLRNSGISPTTNHVQPNVAPHRILSSLHNNNSNPQFHEQNQSQSQNQSQTPVNSQSQATKPLIPQNTNGSIHSNFSIQSFHDDGIPLSSASMMSANDLIYKTLSQSGAAGDDLGNNLARSLSGLDMQDGSVANSSSNVNTAASATKKSTIW